ncbi:MAG: hypothetical protein AABW51_04810 [Nanoarchaeota archaeon]
MDPKLKKIIIIILILICILAMVLILKRSLYEKGSLTDSEKNCATYSKQCTCLGFLAEELTYPSAYSCDGIELCRNINKEVC